jgi:hypothetical protein
MPRPPDPKSKSLRISFDPRNDEERELFRRFKALVGRDEETYLAVFLPIMQARVNGDNPQLKFVQRGDNLVLNKSVPARREIFGPRKITCENCHGAGCEHCGGHGVVYIE